MPRQVRLAWVLAGFAGACAFTPVDAELAAGPALALDGGTDAGLVADASPPILDAASPDASSPDAVADDAAAPPLDSGFPDAAAPADAGFPDTGRPPTPCDLEFASEGPLADLRAHAPADATDIRAGHVSDDLLTVYASVLRGSAAHPGELRFEVWVFTRRAATGGFDDGLPTTLDLQGPTMNATSELDLKYVPGLGRFWFTLDNGDYQDVNSAELRAPSDPSDFWTFANEVDGLPELVRNRNYRGPALTGDGLVLIVSRGEPNTDRWHLVEHRRGGSQMPWIVGTQLGTVGSAQDDVDVWLDGDGTRLLFASDRGGDFDLYCSWRADLGSGWATPTVVAPGRVSTAGADERAPYLAAGRLVFSRKAAANEDVRIAAP